MRIDSISGFNSSSYYGYGSNIPGFQEFFKNFQPGNMPSLGSGSPLNFLKISSSTNMIGKMTSFDKNLKQLTSIAILKAKYQAEANKFIKAHNIKFDEKGKPDLSNLNAGERSKWEQLQAAINQVSTLEEGVRGNMRNLVGSL